MPAAADLCGNVDRLPSWSVSICSATPLLPNGAAATHQHQTPEAIRLPRRGTGLHIFLFVFVFPKMLVSAGEADQIDLEEKKKAPWQ